MCCPWCPTPLHWDETVSMNLILKSISHTKYFPIISSNCDSNGCRDLFVFSRLPFKRTYTDKNIKVSITYTTHVRSQDIMFNTSALHDLLDLWTNLLFAPAPLTKRFWGCLSLILFNVMFFLATTHTSPPFPPCPPRRGRPMPPLPPRT